LNKISDLSALWDEIHEYNGIIRLIVDHPKHIEALEEFEQTRGTSRKWSVFIKIDGGYR
jgi:D-serine ammonia-lyase